MSRSTEEHESTFSSEGQHPFLIDLVFETVLFHGDWEFQDVKSFRLVCKLWRDATFDLWRRDLATLTLVQKKNTPSCPGMPIEDFMNHFCDPEDPLQLLERPFSRYKLKNWEIKADSGEDLIDALLGPFVEYLHFDHCTFYNFSETIRTIVFESTPALRELAMTEVTCDENVNDFTAFQDESWPTTESVVSFQLMGTFPIWKLPKLLLKFPNLKVQ